PVTTYLLEIDGEAIKTIGQAAASMTLGDAFNNTDASMALFYAVIFTLFATYIYYVARRLFNIRTASEAITDGIKSMVPALMILAMAWTIGSVINESPADGGLGLANFLSDSVAGGGFPIFLVPIIAFALSALISFSTGTSWGTFAIMIPIVMPIAVSLGQAKGFESAALLNATLISIGAVLGGSVFGDHASPISDTTILSSTGAGCPHLEHVATQMPYAVTVAICALVGFIIGGITLNVAAAWGATLVAFAAAMVLLPRFYTK
ncbi:MAG TPA: Na+/H+ antiporter NhaC family protein, partial [Sphaerochaeta sp.]|nr:Na+/H+ antiporter NhaC family protein [Sphaerochaeta sp.]